MELNTQLKRDIVWLETWITQHPKAVAARHIANLLDAYKQAGGLQDPAEDGVPDSQNAATYVKLRDSILSRVPAGSTWERSISNPDELTANFVLHLYHSHTLGCVECFGGSH